MTQQALEALRPELDAWNAGIKRAREEYAANPITYLRQGRCAYRNCEEKVSSVRRLCRNHWRMS